MHGFDFVGFAFVVFVFGGGVIRSALKTWERRMELQMQRQQGQNSEISGQLQALRAEIAGLRDTSTQFDMSLENAVQRLEERVSRIETRNTTPPPAVVAGASDESQQRVGLR